MSSSRKFAVFDPPIAISSANEGSFKSGLKQLSLNISV